MAESALEAEFALQLRAAKLTDGLAREYRFMPGRRYRFDFCWPEKMLAIELQGGIWTGGRHTRGNGYESDCLKTLEAVLLGWRVIPATPSMVKSGALLNAVDALIGDERGTN